MTDSERVDFDAVRKVIEEDGLDPRHIKIVYEGLSDEEFELLSAVQEDAKRQDSRVVIANYPEHTHIPMFPEKAIKILTLEA